jgi:hypothetical protein
MCQHSSRASDDRWRVSSGMPALKRGLSGCALISDPVVFRGCSASNTWLVAAAVHMIKLTKTREITPYVWVHRDEER